MRFFIPVFLPFLLQVLGFVLVIAVSRGGGSFVGLLALSAAAVTVPIVTLLNWIRAYQKPLLPIIQLMGRALLLALIFPVLLLILRIAEPYL
jgi:hypothetical protein